MLLDECLDWLELLYLRMERALDGIGYRAVALSHHPVEEFFHGPRAVRSEKYWPWAMQAMTTRLDPGTYYIEGDEYGDNTLWGVSVVDNICVSNCF